MNPMDPLEDFCKQMSSLHKTEDVIFRPADKNLRASSDAFQYSHMQTTTLSGHL